MANAVTLAGSGKPWVDGETARGVLFRAADGEEDIAKAPLTVVADGMFSNLRRKLVTDAPVEQPGHFVGLRLPDCRMPHPEQLLFVLADPSPVLVYPLSATEVIALVCRQCAVMRLHHV